MSSQTIICYVILVFAAVHLGHTIPTGSVFSSVRKITLAPMDAKVEPVKYESSNINYKEETLEESIDNHRMVIVTPDGYEYTASYEFTKNLLFSDDDIEEGREKQNIFDEIEKQRQLFTDNMETEDIPTDIKSQELQDIYNQVARFNNRFVVENTEIWPYNAIGRFDSGGSGSFVAPYLILTCAHCIISNVGSKSYASNLQFYRGKPCNGQGTIHNWRYAAVYYRWLTSNHQDFRYDIGWVITQTPSPVYIPFKYTSPPVGHFMHTSGYPFSDARLCQYATTSCMVRQYTLQGHSVEHGCDIENGNSGGPIWAYDQGFMYIFAVQSYHVDSPTHGYNYGCVIDAESGKLTYYYMTYTYA